MFYMCAERAIRLDRGNQRLHVDCEIAHWRLIFCHLITLGQMSVGESLVTSCFGLQNEEPQTADPMPLTWAFHEADNMLSG